MIAVLFTTISINQSSFVRGDDDDDDDDIWTIKK